MQSNTENPALFLIKIVLINQFYLLLWGRRPKFILDILLPFRLSYAKKSCPILISLYYYFTFGRFSDQFSFVPVVYFGSHICQIRWTCLRFVSQANFSVMLTFQLFNCKKMTPSILRLNFTFYHLDLSGISELITKWASFEIYYLVKAPRQNYLMSRAWTNIA